MTFTDNARVDDAGNVYVTESDGERLVGQYADVSPEEAIAFFVRKFNDTNASLVLLEQRMKNGAPASEISESAAKISEQIIARAGIGNYDALQSRLDHLQASLSDLTEVEKHRRAEALEKALADRTLIVESIEKLASRDPSTLRWKDVGVQIESLFSQWQTAQKSSPRLSKKDGDALWKRFRDARNKLEQERRSYFSELDQRTKTTKTVKEELIAAAEKLSGENALSQYRDLLEKWKKAPRAGKKVDDALWARFKAAGDVLYQAKKASDEAEDAAYSGNLDIKLSIIAEAESLLTATNAEQARAKLNELNKRWDAAGKVPRAHMKSTEERMRAVELAVRKLETSQWNASNPEKIARSSGLAGQIEQKIAELTEQREAALKAGNAADVSKLDEAIETQKSWLAVL